MLLKIDNMFKIDFIALNESRMVQLQFATNRIKTGPLEPERQLPKVRDVITLPMTSRDVIILPPVTILLATLYNCFLTVADLQKRHKKFQALRYHIDVVRVHSKFVI